MILINKQVVTEDGRDYEVVTQKSERTGKVYVTKTYIPSDEEVAEIEQEPSLEDKINFIYYKQMGVI